MQRLFCRIVASFLALLLGLGSTGRAAPRPRRLVSICLPGDQLLLQLATREEIAAISWLGADPELSPHWEAAKGVPATRGLAEELVALRPDLVLVGTFTTPVTRAVLERLNVPVLEIGVPSSFEELRALFRKTAQALGPEAEERAGAILARMDRRLAALEARGPDPRPTALFYFQDGYSPGKGTFADALLEAAGYRNLGAEIAAPGAVALSLEEALMAGPDLMIFAAYHENAPTFREAGQNHPAFRELARLRPEMKIVTIPFRHLDCPDPSNLDIVEALLPR